jgi:hypothetical protein
LIANPPFKFRFPKAAPDDLTQSAMIRRSAEWIAAIRRYH